MSLLVIGGTGFVGLNIAEAALSAGRPVAIFDRAPLPEPAARAFAALPGRLEVIEGDVRDAPALTAAIARATDGLIYGAAITGSLERDRDAPETTLDVNLNGLLTALRAARTHAVPRVLNLSSAGAYGATAFHGETPLTEAELPDPRTLYAITKHASERLAARMAEVWSLDTISVRLSGVFGRWERATGFRDTLSPQFQILDTLAAGRPALIERLDRRDWIYGTDVARAVLALMDAPAPRHRLFNISSGKSWSILDWGRALAALIPGSTCRLAQPGEPPSISLHAATDRRPLDTRRLQDETGLGSCMGIEQSVADYHSWARQHGPLS